MTTINDRRVFSCMHELKHCFPFSVKKESRVNKIHLTFSKHLREKEQVLLFITNMAQEMDYEMSLFYLIYSFKMVLYSLIRILRLDIHINANVGIKLYLQNLYIYKLWRECFPNAYLFLIDYVCVKKRRKNMHPIIMSKDVECTHACTFRDQLWMVCHHHARIYKDNDIGAHTHTHVYFEYTSRSFLVLIFKIF